MAICNGYVSSPEGNWLHRNWAQRHFLKESRERMRHQHVPHLELDTCLKKHQHQNQQKNPLKNISRWYLKTQHQSASISRSPCWGKGWNPVIRPQPGGLHLVHTKSSATCERSFLGGAKWHSRSIVDVEVDMRILGMHVYIYICI